MAQEVWIGLVEVRQLPGEDHSITLSRKWAFTWIACWAHDEASYKARVEEVEAEYGLFVVDIQKSMAFIRAEEAGILSDELAEICERTSENESYCIFGTLHNYFEYAILPNLLLFVDYSLTVNIRLFFPRIYFPLFSYEFKVFESIFHKEKTPDFKEF